MSRAALDRLDGLAKHYRLTRNRTIERLLKINGEILDDVLSDQSRGLAERINAKLRPEKKRRSRENKKI